MPNKFSKREFPNSNESNCINKYSKLYLVIHHGKGQEMLLQFDNVTEKEQWWCGLQYFVLLAINNQGYLIAII